MNESIMEEMCELNERVQNLETKFIFYSNLLDASMRRLNQVDDILKKREKNNDKRHSVKGQRRYSHIQGL